MPFDILSLPCDLFPLVVKKLDPLSMAKFRQTTKGMNSFLEENRFKFKFPMKKRVLFFNVELFETEGNIVVDWRYKPSCTISVGTVKNELDLHFYADSHYFQEEKTAIEDPFSELSGFCFDTICVRFPQIGSKRHMNIKKQEVYFEQNVLPLLRALRTSCENLCVERCSVNQMKDLLSSVKFKRIFLNQNWGHDLNEEVLRTWPLEGCVERHMGVINELPPSLSPFIQGMSKVSIRIARKESYPIYLLRDFLTEASVNASLVGNLSHLYLYFELCDFVFHPLPKLDDLPGIQFLWSGIPREVHAKPVLLPRIHRVNIYVKRLTPGRAALIVHESQDGFHVYFVEDDRPNFLDTLLPHIFPYYPVDFSHVMDIFLSADSDEEAFAIFDYDWVTA